MRKNIVSAITAAVLWFAVFGGSFSLQAYAYPEYDEYRDPYYYTSNSFERSKEESDGETSRETKGDSNIVIPNYQADYSGENVQASLFGGQFYQSENVYLCDEAAIFTDEDLEEIQKLLTRTARSTNMNIALFIGGVYRDDDLTERFTISALKAIFGNEPYTNSIMLYLDFEGHSPSYDLIRTQHDANLYITGEEGEGRIGHILENMYQYLPKSGETVYRSKVKSAIEAFCSDVDTYINESGMIDKEYYYNEELGVYRFNFYGTIVETTIRPYKYPLFFLVIGVMISYLTGFVSISVIQNKYKFRVAQDISAYTSENDIHKNIEQDIFISEHTTRTKIETSGGGGSSGGRGRGGGGGGGGGSFGGGGGHR